MKVTAEHLEKTQFEIVARNHRVLSDQPTDNGGDDGGMTPPELFLAALASCAGYYAFEYLSARRLPANNFRVFVSAEKEKLPARLTNFRIELSGIYVEPRHQEGVRRAVKSCLIHNTLLASPAIEVVLNNAQADNQLSPLSTLVSERPSN